MAARAGAAAAAPAASTADAAARAQHLKELQGLEMEMLRNRAHEAEQRCAAATTDAATFRAEATSLRDQLVHSQVVAETAASKGTAEVRVYSLDTHLPQACHPTRLPGILSVVVVSKDVKKVIHQCVDLRPSCAGTKRVDVRARSGGV